MRLPWIIHRRWQKGTIGSGLLQVSAWVLSFPLNIAMARWLGADQYGAYTYSILWSSILAQVLGAGFDRLLVREIAMSMEICDWRNINSLWRWANQRLVLGSTILAISSLTVSIIFYRIHWLWLMALTVVTCMSALQGLYRSAMQGAGRVVTAALPSQIGHPSLMLIWLAIATFWMERTGNSLQALLAHCAVSIMVLLFGTWLLYRVWGPERHQHGTCLPQPSWRRSLVPLGLITLLTLLSQQADQILLGLFCRHDQVAFYNAAVRGATWVSVLLALGNTALAPEVARLWFQGERKALQHLLTHSSRLVFGGSLLMASIMIFSGRFYLSLFGSAFLTAYPAMIIMILGQLCNVALGGVALLLTMTGHEKSALNGIAWGAAANLTLSLVLIPLLGMIGAAIASTSGLILWNLILWRRVHRLLRLETAAFNRYETEC